MYRRRGSGSLPQTGLNLVSVIVDEMDNQVVSWTFDAPFTLDDPDLGAWAELTVDSNSPDAIVSIDDLDGQVSLHYPDPVTAGVSDYLLAAQPVGTSTPIRVPQSGTVM